MMSTNISIETVLAQPQDFVGREVAVDGVLLVDGRLLSGGDSRLVACIDRPDDSAIQLSQPEVEQRLLAVVPAWGGGRFIYCDDATVVGVLSVDPLCFVTVRTLIIRRDDQVYQLDDVM